MLKNCTLIILLLACVLMIKPVYSQNAPIETITRIEIEIGLPHKGTIIERLNELEMVSFGEKYSNESIDARVARLKKDLLPDSASDLIVPVNSGQFDKEVDDGLRCYGDVCGQQGVVEYFEGENKMTINSQKLIDQYATTEIKNNLPDFLVFMDRENDVNLMDLGFVFNDTIGCGSVYLGEIDKVDYPGVDKVRAIYAIDTQGGIEGNFAVRVYAIKGDQYIMLKTLSTLSTYEKSSRSGTFYQKCLDEFNVEGDPSENCSFVECFKENLQNDGKIQGILSRQAQTLIDLFAIK